MKKIIILIIAACSILGASSWFIWSMRKNQVIITGVIRTSGLLDEEKQTRELTFTNYQVTGFGDYDRAYQEEQIKGYYLVSDNMKDDLMGKCTRITGSVPEEWKNKDKIREAYGRSVLSVKSIKTIDYSNCNPYPDSLRQWPQQGNNLAKLILQGIVVRGARPAPDIGYDYLLKLSESFEKLSPNVENFPDKTGMIDIIPTINDQWIFLENNIGREISLEGYLEWGYAESQYFSIINIKK